MLQRERTITEGARRNSENETQYDLWLAMDDDDAVADDDHDERLRLH